MPWYVWAFIIYAAIDAVYIIAKIGEFVEITKAGAVTALVYKGALIYTLVYLATH